MSKMIVERALLQQAQEALEHVARQPVGARVTDAITALRAALAEQQEPVRELLISAACMAVVAERKGAYPGASLVADAVLESASPQPAQPVQEPERATVGPHLQKQARRLLEQLAANRPRRALDVDSTRRLLEVISAPGETDKLIADLIRSAWEWGVSCEVDDVRWGEAGDSHNQWLRDRTNDAATRLHAAVLTSGKKPNKQAEPDSPERRCGGPGCDGTCCQPVQQSFDFLAHLRRQAEFSARTFGPGARVEGVTDHIAKELQEVRDSGGALAEWVDVIILGLDGAWRSGASPEQIVEALVAKQTKNEGRKWPDWRTAPAGKAIEHDRSQEQAQPAQPAQQVVQLSDSPLEADNT